MNLFVKLYRKDEKTKEKWPLSVYHFENISEGQWQRIKRILDETQTERNED